MAAIHADATGILPVRRRGHSQELSGAGPQGARRMAVTLPARDRVVQMPRCNLARSPRAFSRMRGN
ncbi:hypothetical protein BCEP4_790033 [Burkholderia cepacia]|nr:hypothetical protein BCEP4_790033 [Burkholderia cepacia]